MLHPFAKSKERAGFVEYINCVIFLSPGPWAIAILTRWQILYIFLFFFRKGSMQFLTKECVHFSLCLEFRRKKEKIKIFIRDYKKGTKGRKRKRKSKGKVNFWNYYCTNCVKMTERDDKNTLTEKQDLDDDSHNKRKNIKLDRANDFMLHEV